MYVYSDETSVCAKSYNKYSQMCKLKSQEIKTVGKLFIILISIQQQCYILCNVAVYIILEGQVHQIIMPND